MELCFVWITMDFCMEYYDFGRELVGKCLYGYYLFQF